MIDRYTYYALEFLEKVQPNSDKTMGEFVCLEINAYLNSIWIYFILRLF